MVNSDRRHILELAPLSPKIKGQRGDGVTVSVKCYANCEIARLLPLPKEALCCQETGRERREILSQDEKTFGGRPIHNKTANISWLHPSAPFATKAKTD